MAENVLETVQKFVQDVIAPDVRELKVEVKDLGRRIDALEKHLDQRFLSAREEADARFERVDTQFERVDAQFERVLAAISESRATSEVTALREIAGLRERIAVLETQQNARRAA